MNSVSEFFIYTANIGTLAAGISSTTRIQIESDSQFVVQKLTYFVTDSSETSQTDATRIVPNLALSIVDTGSGRNLQNDSIPITSICGTGELPHILATPKTFKANSIITVQVSNFATTNYANIFINFIGKKIFAIAPIGPRA